MQPFIRLDAKAAPLDIDNLDTDQIIPKQFLKTVEREGLGKGLFYDLRFDEAGAPKPDFVLNDPRYAGAGVLIAGDNFGCGSSREHAPWALLDYGVRCVVAPSFADIFYNNCFQNGLLPVALPADQVRALMGEAKGGNHVFSVDLESQTVTAPSGAAFRFEIDPGRKEKLLKGLDAIGETLQAAPAIDTFEHRKALSQPWLEPAA
ncbi:3-isopropylmalate dehydratase small subunit [Caulobacter sp. KR2-114]|uniref:3-isopropylmalate dehydratase small subunit n=1 Tax=Caulobacter sp. KR2-114 TaxID=3400912 RepID=UPI003C0326D3